MQEVKGTILDVVNRRIVKGVVEVESGRIKQIREADEVPDQFVLPGFIDSHVHIESSMLVPSEFARLAVRHGTVATVSDPHEIANVCGMEGVEYMIENGEKVPFKFYFGAPSCVPATPFETAGAVLGVDEVTRLLDREEIPYLSEMMNWPGVLQRDEEVMAKIHAARERGKPVDGHAPGLTGDKAEQYASAGITTDHECFTLKEAVDKLKAGMKIAIREGSAARNYDELLPLLGDYPGKIMFCSDDKHPDDLIRGYFDQLAARTLAKGYDLFDLLKAFCILPIDHYGLDVGKLQPGDPADFIVVKEPETMEVIQTWIDGECVYDRGSVLIPRVEVNPINNFVSRTTRPSEFRVDAGRDTVPVIVAEDGQIVTGKSFETLSAAEGDLQPDPGRDILKITVVNRYQEALPATGFIKNFGIREGAIASSVAHDSHNIIAVGSSNRYLSEAVNLVMEHRGGVAAVDADRKEILPLPVAGLMSDQTGEEVAGGYERLDRTAKEMGSNLKAPFMVISFMALLVIPSLKISDKGMFDGETFEFI